MVFRSQQGAKREVHIRQNSLRRAYNLGRGGGRRGDNNSSHDPQPLMEYSNFHTNAAERQLYYLIYSPRTWTFFVVLNLIQFIRQ